ncbi:MAG: hypothetical protein IJC51_04545 [Eggerthellaceae bacterium]|nr:hypothetical protein [Eggerthellaceae bacterium]
MDAMTRVDTAERRQKPTSLFLFYAGQLAFRLALFAYCLHLLFVKPDVLSPSEHFGLAHGFNFVDFVFLVILADFATKFFSRAKLAMGSLKQYPAYHVPTPRTFEGGRKALVAYLHELVRKFAETRVVAGETYAALDDTRKSIMADIRTFITNIDFLHWAPFRKEDLTVDDPLRAALHKDRLREVVPTAIAWIALNGVVALVLWRLGILNERIAVVWSLFYFVFDMICVVLWCPIQLLLMKNRCCTTCQIFNWDAIMVATPLIFAGGWFGLILIGVALVVLVRWEMAAAHNPERFDERTNALLQCANCKDQLCFIRTPYRNPKRASLDQERAGQIQTDTVQ